jgi:hypothetical protein
VSSFHAAAVAALMAMWSSEAGVGVDDERWGDKRDEVDYLVQTFADASSVDPLVDARTDVLLLGSVAWYESRLSLRPKDGDPLHLPGGDVGTVVGPMQISKAAPSWVKNWPELAKKWPGLTVEAMRDPVVNIRLAHDILSFWKTQCGGPPGVWLTAYGWGRCPNVRGRGHVVDWEGRRRCRTMRRLMDRVASEDVGYSVPLDWACEVDHARTVPNPQ